MIMGIIIGVLLATLGILLISCALGIINIPNSTNDTINNITNATENITNTTSNISLKTSNTNTHINKQNKNSGNDVLYTEYYGDKETGDMNSGPLIIHYRDGTKSWKTQDGKTHERVSENTELVI